MKFEALIKLHQKKYRTKLGYYLVEGEHLILELQKAALQQDYLYGSTLYVTEKTVSWATKNASKFELCVINQKQMAKLSDTQTPQDLIACVPFPPKLHNKPALNKKVRSFYLHEIQDPGNLGTIMRSLAWFGNFDLLLSPNSVDPFNTKVVRASMGAIFHLNVEQNVALDTLSSRFDSFAYLDMHGQNIQNTKFADFECYLFGNEARGVPSSALLTYNASAFTIGGKGQIESLNLASVVGICAYALSC